MSTPVSAKRSVRHPAILTAGVCAVLLILFWARSGTAAAGKSSTYDEPMHALGSWVHWHLADWRINFEDPPLWQYWASMFVGHDQMDANHRSPAWQQMDDDWNLQWIWTVETLYRNDPANMSKAATRAAGATTRPSERGNYGEAFVWRMRKMMIVLGVALGALIAWWGYRICGIVAGLTAAGFYSLDPNFLGHAALVKNDVAMAVCLSGLCFALWSMGTRLTLLNLAGVSVACGAAMTSKFSGVLLAPLMLVLLLGFRAAMPWPWQVWKWTLNRAVHRFIAAVGVGAVAAGYSFIWIWVVYGFQFPASPEPLVRLNLQSTLQQAALFKAQAKAGGTMEASEQEKAILGFVRWYDERFPNEPRRIAPEVIERAKTAEPWRPPASIQLGVWMLENRLLPEGFTHGLLFVQARSYIRGSYLNGERSTVGFVSYFPLAIAYKTPLATLIGVAGALGVLGFVVIKRRSAESPAAAAAPWWWTGACLLTPVVVYLMISIGSNLNIGFRHLLPIYPMLFLLIGWAAATAAGAWNRGYWPAVGTAGALGLLLAVESFAISPDHLTFFNAAAGGQRGGLSRLGDSNLDWGQDLPALAKWQNRPENKDAPLYLSYFGIVDPGAYGIRYINMPGGWMLNPETKVPPDTGAVVAISATNLQNIYIAEPTRPLYDKYRAMQPTEVLGGTIYIYDLRQKR